MNKRARHLRSAGMALIGVLALAGACANPAGENPVPVAELAISPANPSVEPGGTLQLTAAVSPDNATDKTVAWTSSDPAVATVSAAGLVTGKAAGTADITATSADGPSDTVTVTVAATVPLTGIQLSPISLSIGEGAAGSFTVIYDPPDTTQTGVTWSCDDPSVATVNAATGAISAVAAGTATVTAASTVDPAKTASATVSVFVPIPLTGLSLSPASLALTKGVSGALTPIFTPTNTTQTGVTWSSSDPAVATVSNGAVTAVGGGTAVITAASTEHPDKTAAVTVTVTVPLLGIQLSPDPLSIGEGDTGSFTVIYDPPDTTQTGLSWSSDDPTAATVAAATGAITGVAAGQATITAASTAVAGKTASAVVNVFVPIPLAGLTVSPDPLALNKGVSGALTPAFTPPDTTQTGVTWSSSNTAVATVSNGVVTAVGGGTAVITAASTANSSIRAAATVNVTVPLTGILLSPNPLALTGVGTTAALTVNYTPPDTTQTGVTWSSGAPSVASVSGGTVAAVAGGTAVITATSTANSSIRATAAVNVIIPITALSVSPASLALTKGASGALTPAFTPATTTQTGITWSSSNTAVATVSNGTVTAVGGGTAVITAASTANSRIQASATVNVTSFLTGIQLSPNPLRVGTGRTGSFTVIYDPPDTTQKGVTWSSDDTAVATVNAATGAITGVAAGQATITATSAAVPAKTASATVEVFNPILITGVTLSPANLALTKGASGALTPAFTPPNTTDTDLIWTSSAPLVATVSGGTVTAVGGGTAVITATAALDSSISAAVTVTVTVPLTGISLSPDPLAISGVGATGSFTVQYIPPDATEKGVTWSSDAAGVATVSNGTVTAVAGGTAVITAASTANSGIQASATVNVTIPITGLGLNATTLSLPKDGSDTLTVTYTPAGTTQTGVIWTSSAPSVATVFGGTVTAVGGGTAIITAASAFDSSIRDTATVTVTVPLTGLRLPAAGAVGVGKTASLLVEYLPPDATETGITWTSSAPSVATVHSSTGVITGVAIGTATITATSTANGSLSAVCAVTVRASGAEATIRFESFEDETIALTDTVNQGTQLVVAAPAGFVRYLWFVDGSPFIPWYSESLPTLAIAASPGRHYITVIVEKTDGSHFSKTVHYTVGY